MSSLRRNHVLVVEDVGDVAIVRFTEGVIRRYEVDKFLEMEDDLHNLVDQFGRHKILLDLTGVSFLCGRGLYMIIKLKCKIQLAQGTLVICNVQRNLREVFEILRLDEFLTISPLLGKPGRAEILHEHFGITFRPVPIDSEWRTETVVQLAQLMYDTRDFTVLPILADALQDAGCDNADVLDHCRGSGVHTHECWVVDLLLGKQ